MPPASQPTTVNGPQPTSSPASPLGVHPKRLVFAETLAAVPMLGAIAAHYANATKADLRAEAGEIQAAKAALWAQLDEQGITDAIPVTWMAEQGKSRRYLQAWDGRHRTEWALARGHKTVPVHHVTEAQGRALLESTVVGRRHWTKGQLAWLAVNLYSEVAGNTRSTRIGKASHSVGSPEKSHSVGLTVDDLATRFGVSPALVDQAVKLFRIFTMAPSLRQKYEPGIWLGHGLGAVLAGIPGGETTVDKPKVPLGFGSFSGPFATMNTLAKKFSTWNPDQKSACRDVWTAWLQGLPEDFRLVITEAVTLSAPQDS